MFRAQLFVYLIVCLSVCLFCVLLAVALASGRAYLRLGRELQVILKVLVPGKGFKRMVMASRDMILSMITVVIIIVQRLHLLRTRHLRGLHIWLPPVRTKLRFVCSHQSVAVVPSVLVLGDVEYHSWEHKIEYGVNICGKDETRPSEETKIGLSLFKPMHATSRIIQTQTVEQALENVP